MRCEMVADAAEAHKRFPANLTINRLCRGLGSLNGVCPLGRLRSTGNAARSPQRVSPWAENELLRLKNS